MAWNDTDTHWMKRAIALAREGQAEPGKNPIGCVIVRDGQVIGEACNEVDLRHDATAHAEILAIGPAGAKLKCNELVDAVLYTTLQPCGMCTMASIWAKSVVSSMAQAVTMSTTCISRIVNSTPWISSATLTRTTSRSKAA